MSDSPATRKQLKIKAGVVKRFVFLHVDSCSGDADSIPLQRYQKELALYRTEVVEHQRKLQTFTATASTNGEGGESWDVRNAVREISDLFLTPFTFRSMDVLFLNRRV